MARLRDALIRSGVQLMPPLIELAFLSLLWATARHW